MTTPKKTLRAAAPAVPVANNPVNILPSDLQNAQAPAATSAVPDAPAAQADAPAPEIAKIGAEAAKLGLTIDVSAALTAGTKPDALRRAVLEQLAATTDATIIASIAPRVVDAPPKENPLIAAAEAAAKTA